VGVFELLQVAGAVIILVAYWAMESGRIGPHSAVYLWLNIAGSVLLGAIAIIGQLWGFLLLEIAWTGISIRSLLKPGPAGDQPSP